MEFNFARNVLIGVNFAILALNHLIACKFHSIMLHWIGPMFDSSVDFWVLVIDLPIWQTELDWQVHFWHQEAIFVKTL